jgi:hypothetical protein
MSDNNNESRILKDREKAAQQSALFDDEEIPIDRTRRRKYRCNGERLKGKDPELYEAIVEALADPGVTIKWICDNLGVSEELLRAVRACEKIPISEEKERLLSNITYGLRLATERAIETLPTASTKDAVLTVGVFTDKMQLLAGEATARIEEVHHIDIYEHWKKFLAGEAPGLADGKYLPVLEGELTQNGEGTAALPPPSLPDSSGGLEKTAQVHVESSAEDSTRQNDESENHDGVK